MTYERRHETRRSVPIDGDWLGPCGDPRLRPGGPKRRCGHLLVFDHVLGGMLDGFAGCLHSASSAAPHRILPQRQTALVAKQAAAVNVLTDGCLRLGEGIGWNHVEYEALDEDFHIPRPPRQRADRRLAEALERAAGEL